MSVMKFWINGNIEKQKMNDTYNKTDFHAMWILQNNLQLIEYLVILLLFNNVNIALFICNFSVIFHNCTPIIYGI